MKLQTQLFLDVENLSVPRVTPFSGRKPVNVMVLPRGGPLVALVGRVAASPYDTAATTLYAASGRLNPLQLELTDWLDRHDVLDELSCLFKNRGRFTGVGGHTGQSNDEASYRTEQTIFPWSAGCRSPVRQRVRR